MAETWGYAGFLTEKEEASRAELEEKLRAEGLDEYTELRCLLRFCRARKFNVKKTLKMILEENEWRKQFRGHAFKLEDFPSMLQFCDDGLVKTGGRDKDGRPVVYLMPSLYFPSQVGSEEELVLFFVYYMDSLLTMADEQSREDFSLVFDMSNWTFKNFSLPQVKVMIHILQNYYPERLGRVFVIHVPILFRAVYNIVYPLLDERTRLKIQILGKEVSKIQEFIDPLALEKKYGGQHGSYPNRDSIVSPLYRAAEELLELQREEERKKELAHQLTQSVDEGEGDVDTDTDVEFDSQGAVEMDVTARKPGFIRRRLRFMGSKFSSSSALTASPSPRKGRTSLVQSAPSGSSTRFSEEEFNKSLQESTEKITLILARLDKLEARVDKLSSTRIPQASALKGSAHPPSSSPSSYLKPVIGPTLVVILAVQLWCLKILFEVSVVSRRTDTDVLTTPS